jgi:hypothetical protein
MKDEVAFVIVEFVVPAAEPESLGRYISLTIQKEACTFARSVHIDENVNNVAT